MLYRQNLSPTLSLVRLDPACDAICVQCFRIGTVFNVNYKGLSPKYSRICTETEGGILTGQCQERWGSVAGMYGKRRLCVMHVRESRKTLHIRASPSAQLESPSGNSIHLARLTPDMPLVGFQNSNDLTRLPDPVWRHTIPIQEFETF